MAALKLELTNNIGVKLIVLASMLVMLPSARSHDLSDYWDADVTPIMCLMETRAGWERDEKYDEMKPGPVTVRVFVGTLHPGAENPFSRITELDTEPYFIFLQVNGWTQRRLDDTTISSFDVLLGDESVSPIPDSEREFDNMPVSYLGGEAGDRFVEMLEQGMSPVVSVVLSNDRKVAVPISVTGFKVAHAMMETCKQSVRDGGFN